MADYQFISAFLSTVEGPCQKVGYIPCHIGTGGTANYKGGPNPEKYSAMGKSGVTIATGCDLGQTDAETLSSYGLHHLIINLYTPYFGKKRDAAIRVLHEKPLVISSDNAAQTDAAVHRGYLDRYVRPAFEKGANASFDAMPKEAQAVIMSCCFHKGCGGVRRDWPKLWGHFMRQDWRAASHELIHGFKQYASRRRKEGELLAGVAK